MITLNWKTRMMILVFAQVISMLVLMGGVYLIRANFDTISLVCGWYMVADGVLTFIVVAVYNYIHRHEKERDDEEDQTFLNSVKVNNGSVWV